MRRRFGPKTRAALCIKRASPHVYCIAPHVTAGVCRSCRRSTMIWSSCMSFAGSSFSPAPWRLRGHRGAPRTRFMKLSAGCCAVTFVPTTWRVCVSSGASCGAGPGSPPRHGRRAPARLHFRHVGTTRSIGRRRGIPRAAGAQLARPVGGRARDGRAACVRRIDVSANCGGTRHPAGNRGELVSARCAEAGAALEVVDGSF